MKTTITTLFAIAFSLGVFAQNDTMFVHTNKHIHEFSTAEVDSIIFYRTQEKMILPCDTVFRMDTITKTDTIIKADTITIIETDTIIKTDTTTIIEIDTIIQIQTDTVIFMDTVIEIRIDTIIIHNDTVFVPVCHVCFEQDCETDHVRCTICKAWDCEKNHVLCDVCNEWDCEICHIPIITNHPNPIAQTTNINWGFSQLSITITNSVSPSIQWYSNTDSNNTNGALIEGATSRFFEPIADSLGEMYYYAVVSNACGNDTSNVSGRHTVTCTPPAITTHPSSIDQTKEHFQIDYEYNFSPLHSFATGSLPLSILWYSNTVKNNENGTPIYDPMEIWDEEWWEWADFLPGSDTVGASYYYYVVTNGCGSDTSDVSGRHTVLCPAPSFWYHPSSTPYTRELFTAFWGLTALGNCPLGSSITYQWYSNTENNNQTGTAIDDATESYFQPPSAVAGEMYYYCVMTNECGARDTSNVSGLHTVVVSVSDIKLDQTAIALHIDSSTTLLATVLPENSTNQTISWHSSNPDVASVNNGVVIAKSVGTAMITVTTEDRGKIANCEVTTYVKCDICGDWNCELNHEFCDICNAWDCGKTHGWCDRCNEWDCEITHVTNIYTAGSFGLEIGKSFKMSATIWPQDATNKNIVWNSSNEAVATVENGVVTTHSVGFATITATTEDGGLKDSSIAEGFMVLENGCNTRRPQWGESLGTVSFATTQQWTIGNQIWSDAVQTTKCNTLSPSIWVGYVNPNCHANPGYKGNLFSWCAVVRFADSLCPYPWRVPTIEDFEELDRALGGDGSHESRNNSELRDNYLNIWGAQYSGYVSGTRDRQGLQFHYWSQTEPASNVSNAHQLNVCHAAWISLSAFSKSLGLSLRCVRNL